MPREQYTARKPAAMKHTHEQVIPAHKKIEKGDLFWLSYLIFFVIEAVTRKSVLYWFETLAILSIFVALYIWFLRFCDLRRRLFALGGMALLGLVTFPGNSGGSSFLIYAAALLPFVVSSVPLVFALQAAECLLLAGEAFVFHVSPWGVWPCILLILTIGISNIGFANKARADRLLRMQAEEIEALAAVAERERIARDLHDVLGHTLSVIVLKAELAHRLLQLQMPSLESDNTVQSEATQNAALHRAASEIAEVERTARTALAEVREAIGGYRCRGLRAEIDGARTTLRSAGVTLHTGDALDITGFTAAEETVLALALREAVTNIVRHAHATECTLQLWRENGQHRLSIQDNGSHARAHEGNGLRGMRERVEALGGHLRLTREAGTLLQIDLPSSV